MSAPDWRPADFAYAIGDRLLCTLCPHGCTLADGQTGRCAVRRNHGGCLETATYATAVQHRHAIERKPLYHYRPGSTVLTLAAPGCTFACTYCQNYRLSQHGRHPQAPWSAEAIEPDAIADAIADDTEAIAVAFSYAEPTLAAELTLALAARGVDVIWQSNGFITPAAALRLAPALAAVNVDLKAADEATHRRLTGASLAPIGEALALWRAAGVWIELSTPLIPGVNDDERSIEGLIDRVLALGAGTPWHLLRFHPDFRLQGAPPTPPALLARVRDRARARGLLHVYVERALGAEGRATRCPGCDAVVVSRHVGALDAITLRDGGCARCGTEIAGRWEMS